MFAHHAAVRDPRVSGVVFLDGYGYRTLGYRLRHYLPRLGQLSSWVSLLRRLAARFVPSAVTPRHPRAPRFDAYFLDFPPRRRVRAELKALLERGANLLFLNSGGLQTQYFNHERQFREMYGDLDPSRARLTVVYDERADHVYCGLDVRAAMLARVETWMMRFARRCEPAARATGGQIASDCARARLAL
jgi:hypothetical protein